MTSMVDERGRRDEPEGGEQRRMVGPHEVRLGRDRRVDAVVLMGADESRLHCGPPRIAFEPSPLAPPLADLQTPPPVRQLERRVLGRTPVVGLLGRHERREEMERAVALVDERRHEPHRLVDEFGPGLDGLSARVAAVQQLGEVRRMGLLPDEERADLVGAVAAVGPDLLGPARPVVALLARRCLRHWQDPAVPVETPLEQLRPAPRGEVGGVPPVHLEMELALPRVGHQPGLLGR